MAQKSKGLGDYRFLIPHYGDIPLLLGLFKGELWIKQYQIWVKGDTVSLLAALGKLFGFFVTVYAFPVRVFLRYRHGIYSIGWFLTAFTALTIAFFNWPGREYKWTPMYPIWFPIRELFNLYFSPNSASWWPDMIARVYSPSLFWLCLVFCAVAAIHILISYFTVKGDERDIKRGIPVFWKLSSMLSNKWQDKERIFVWWVLESAFAGGIGAFLYYGFHDRILGLFLLYSAACHFALEAYESIWLSRIVSR